MRIKKIPKCASFRRSRRIAFTEHTVRVVSRIPAPVYNYGHYIIKHGFPSNKKPFSYSEIIKMSCTEHSLFKARNVIFSVEMLSHVKELSCSSLIKILFLVISSNRGLTSFRARGIFLALVEIRLMSPQRTTSCLNGLNITFCSTYINECTK